jgi:hypothetical protein
MAAVPAAIPAPSEEGDDARKSSLLRKTTIGLAGGGLIAAGVVMLVTPGPGLLTIAGGLTVLSKEFSSADRLVTRMRQETFDRLRDRRSN